MKFTLSWLKEYLDTDEPLEKLADKLTMIGLEVEHIEDKAKALAPFTVARVISAEQHPNADRLRVCMVDTGEGDRSLEYWRSAHRSYFGRQGKFREDMMLMCERFRLIEVFKGGTLSVPTPLVGPQRGGSNEAPIEGMSKWT